MVSNVTIHWSKMYGVPLISSGFIEAILPTGIKASIRASEISLIPSGTLRHLTERKDLLVSAGIYPKYVQFGIFRPFAA